MKEEVYQRCVRSAMLYGNETWFFEEVVDSEANRHSYDTTNVWCGTSGQKEH